jgi:hypothetical protein
MGPSTLTAKQLACLASPVRNEVFLQLRTLGQASVGDIARATGRKPEAVHYHVKALVQVSLAREAFRRQSAKKPEAVYEPVGKKLRLPKPTDSPEIAGLIRKTVVAGFRQSIRGYTEAARRAESDPDTLRYMHVIKLLARLSATDAKEFMKRIEDAVQFADDHRREDGLKIVWSSVVYPSKKPR